MCRRYRDIPAGKQPELDDADIFHDKRGLRRPHHAHGDIGLLAQQILVAVAEMNLEPQFGVTLAKRLQHGGQHFGADDFTGSERTVPAPQPDRAPTRG